MAGTAPKHEEGRARARYGGDREDACPAGRHEPSGGEAVPPVEEVAGWTGDRKSHGNRWGGSQPPSASLADGTTSEREENTRKTREGTGQTTYRNPSRLLRARERSYAYPPRAGCE